MVAVVIITLSVLNIALVGVIVAQSVMHNKSMFKMAQSAYFARASRSVAEYVQAETTVNKETPKASNVNTFSELNEPYFDTKKIEDSGYVGQPPDVS